MKYLGYYAKNAVVERSNPLAAVTKMDYVANVLSRNEYTEIISASGVLGNKSDIAHTQRINDNLSVHYFYSVGRKNPILGKIGTLLLHLQLLHYLLTQAKRDEPIIVYHSLGYMRIIRCARKIKKFKLILEVEEIYADVSENKKTRRKELQFFRCADAYIFPTKLLSNEINKSNKPEVIIHGTYQVEPDRKCNIFKDDIQESVEKVIHCVYAGTFDPTKGGAAAAAAAEFLPENYHVHILGFGTDEQKKQLQELIAAVQKKTKCTLTYDGLNSGEEYIQFLQKCHIGLCTQIPDAKYTETSFPSKVLVYLANGLRVLSVRIPAVENSAVGGILYYYDNQSPQEIANAIMSIPIEEDYNSRQLLNQLDEDCERNLKRLMEKMNNELD